MVRRTWCCLFIVAALLGCEEEPDTPFVSELLPDTATRYTAARTVTVIGGRFRNGAVILWDDQVRPAAFVNSSELLWTVPATDLLYDDTVFVSVRNPGPDESISNSAPFYVEGAFQFVLSEPRGGAQTNVNFPAPIRAYFRRALDPASLTTTTFAARDSGTGLDAAATVTADAATRSAILNPQLLYERTYDIRLTTALRSERGDPLPKDTSWRLYTPLARIAPLVFGETISSLARGPTGTLLLAYQFGPDGLRTSTCAQNCSDSVSWQHDQTSYPGGPYLSLAVDGQGQKHLAVVAFPHLVMYGNGSATSPTWQFVEVDGGDAFVDLKIELNGRIHIVYFDDGPGDLRYATCAAGCEQAINWTKRVIDSAGNTGSYAAIAVRTDGSLHAVYRESGTADLRYATCSSSCETSPWQTTTIDSVGSVGWGGGIGVDAGGALHVAAFDHTNGIVKYGSCAAACATAANWQFVPVASVANPASGTFQGSYYVRISVHSGGVTLVYQDRRNAFLYNATCTSACTAPANWLVQRVSRNVQIHVPEVLAPSLLVDGAGFRHVVFGGLSYIRY